MRYFFPSIESLFTQNFGITKSS